jgi:hypothetical protein
VKEWCEECGEYTNRNTGGCAKHIMKITITDSTQFVNLYDRNSDPGVYHCRHELGVAMNYTYCPSCGERI